MTLTDEVKAGDGFVQVSTWGSGVGAGDGSGAGLSSLIHWEAIRLARSSDVSPASFLAAS